MKVCPEPHLRTVAGRKFENVAGITAIGAYLMPNATLYPLMPLNLYVRAPSEAWCILQGESPCRGRVSLG
jgi:hypothetical protein